MKASIKEPYRGLQHDQIDNIVKVIQDFPYLETELLESILPHIAQWLYDVYINKESTCLIISEIINVNHLQEVIDNIYKGIIKYPAKSKLNDYLTSEEYDALENAIEPRKNDRVVKGSFDENQKIKINYKTKKVYLSRTKHNPDNTTTEIDKPIIEAVPLELTVYDAYLTEQLRTFKIKWSSFVTDKNFITSGENTGATIQDISRYLSDGGFSHQPKLLDGVISCMINTLILNKEAIIKTDIDNPGFYYDPANDKITPIKKVVRKPSRKEMGECAKWLHELSKAYEGYTSTLATVLKWCTMAPFNYAMKQAGNNMDWLYMRGTSHSGKTTLGRVGMFINELPDTNINDLGGSSIDTVARLGAIVSRSCDPLIVNEPASVFERKSTKEMIKLCVQSTTARSKYIGSHYTNIPAFAPILFTANMYLPEDDAIINRMHIISFTYTQRKTDAEKEAFENKFHVKSSYLSPLKSLKYLGQFAATEIISNPGLLLDDWKKTADYIVTAFYKSMGVDVPKWLLSWEESESIDDLDDTQREDIRNFFVSELNNARKKINVYNHDGYKSTATLDVEEATTSDDFTDINWSIVNNRMLTWAIPFTSRNNTKYICLTQGLRKSLGDKLDFCSDLKSIGELMGWKYGPVRVGNGKVMKLIKVNFEEFMGFLYPNVNLEDV